MLRPAAILARIALLPSQGATASSGHFRSSHGAGYNSSETQSNPSYVPTTSNSKVVARVQHDLHGRTSPTKYVSTEECFPWTI